MSLKKAEARFKRAWDAAGKKLKRELPGVMSVTESADPTIGDMVVAFSGQIEANLDALQLTGCKLCFIVAKSAVLDVPTDWISAPSRILFPESAADRLHNALLDAGIADWIDIRTAEDGVNLTAELLDTLNLGQLAALKVGYDIPLLVHGLDQPIYAFAERNSTVEASAPLVDPAKVETRVRQCWAGAHGGKIASIEATDDPRLFFVEHVKPVPESVRFFPHGLTWHFVTPTRSSVHVTDDLWSKLLNADQPVRPADQQPAVPEAKTEAVEVPVVEAPPAPAASDAEITRLRIDLARAEDRIATLQGAIRAMTPAANEWKTLRLPVRMDGSKETPHPEIAQQEALGWKVNQFLVDAGYLLVVMKREAAAPANGKHYSTTAISVPVVYQSVPTNGASARAAAMIAEMDAELAPTVNALKASFQRMVVMNG